MLGSRIESRKDEQGAEEDGYGNTIEDSHHFALLG
jgi:hypothetical protein